MKINPNIYKKAANLITHDGHATVGHRGACSALDSATQSNAQFISHRELFSDYFKPDATIDAYWFGSRYTLENRLARELALDLMSLIAEDLK